MGNDVLIKKEQTLRWSSLNSYPIMIKRCKNSRVKLYLPCMPIPTSAHTEKSRTDKS